MNKQTRLQEKRVELDLIDNALLKLLEARKKRVSDIARWKEENGLPKLDSAREDQIIATILESSNGTFAHEELETIFRDIISRCRPAVVAYR